MIELLFELLNKVGFTHPLHPAITHLPMGMVMGAFLFALASYRKADLIITAWYCAIVALIFVLPTALIGIIDWQHFYAGELSNHIIIKFVLAGVLAVLLGIIAKVGRVESPSIKLVALYGLCLATCIGLGFTGGEIQFG